MSIVQPSELLWLWPGLLLYLVATLVSLHQTRASGRGAASNIGGHNGDLGRTLDKVILSLLVAGLAFITLAIAERWLRLGHGPFLNMFEILMSSLFSLGLVYAAAYWRLPVIRPTAVIVLPLLLIMVLWLLSVNPTDSHFPPTYETPVLWFHVTLGKGFLGTALIGVGIAGAILLRSRPRLASCFRMMPGDADLDRIAWRFMLVALVFESAMLIAGAVWAQDAWGRYWAWDPLETWAFLTWLALAGAIHLRLSYRISPRAGAMLILAVFVLAFLTFFGVPFVSPAPHKGAV